jgi:hypothetical protein
MEAFTATIGVMPETESNSRPSRERVIEAAAALKSAGFEVLHSGRFGVTVRGQLTTYVQVFGVTPKANAALTARISPTAPELARLVDRIEIAPKAELLASGTTS